MNEIIQLGEFNGVTIDARPSDQYINATAMCKATGKRWNDYAANAQSQDFLAALSRSTRIPVDLLLVKIVDGPNDRRGTWVHEDVAIHLAQWCSPEFAVLVSKWVRALLRTGSVAVHREHSEANLGRYFGELAGVLVGVKDALIDLRTDHNSLHVKVDDVQQEVCGLRVDVRQMGDRLSRVEKRKELSEKTRRIHLECVKRYFGGKCPCCNETQIVDVTGKRLPDGEFDHFKSRSEAAPSHTWLICSDCNSELRDGDKRRDAKVFFDAYQKRRMQSEQGNQLILRGMTP